MAKTILYRLFGAGKVPSTLEDVLHKEKLIHAEEGIALVVAFDHYKAPGKRFKNKVTRLSAYICITEKGLHCPGFGRLPSKFEWIDPRLSSLILNTNNEALIVRFESNIFDDKAEGMVEYRFKCDNPENLLNLIKELIERSRSEN